MCKGAGSILWISKHIPGDKGRIIRCPECSNLLQYSRLTAEEQMHTIDDIKDRADDSRGEMLALRFLGKEMLREPYGFLSIWGHRGSSKSLLCTALVAEFCRHKRPAMYFNASELVTMLSPGDDQQIDGFRVVGNYETAKRRFKEIPVLAIDELDKIKWSAWQIQHIGEIIEWRHRHAAALITLFSMNRPPWRWSNASEVEHISSRLMDGRFNRQWPGNKRQWLPACCNGVPEVPGMFEVTLPDIRPTLRRY